jgi:hypothetical protein
MPHPERRFVETLEGRSLLSSVSAADDFTLFLAGYHDPNAPADAKPFITSPGVDTFTAGQIVTFTGYGESATGARLPASAMQWHVELLNGGDPTPVATTSSATGGSFMVPRDASASSKYRIHLSVTGNAGQTIDTYRDLYPQTVDVKLRSNWDDAEVYLDGQRSYPDVYGHGLVVANSTHEVRFDAGEENGNTVYKFKSARKTAGMGTLRRSGGNAADGLVYTLTAKTTDLSINTRYSSRRIPPARTAGGSEGVIVKYTYYGDSDLTGLYRDTPRPPTQSDVDYSGAATLDDYLHLIAGHA